MRHSPIAVLLLLLPILAFASPPPTGGKDAGETCQKISADFLQNLRNGNFKAATAHFDSRMTAAASPQSVKKLWKVELPQKFGAFKNAGKPKTKHVGKATNILTPLQFAHGKRVMVISCDAERHIQGLFFDAPSPSRAQVIHLSPEALDAYVGRYRLAPRFIFKVFRKGDRLYAQATGQSASRIFPSARNEFFVKGASIRISFQRGKDGNVSGLVLHQHGDHPAPRMASSSSATKAPGSTTTWITKAAVGAKTLPITIERKGFVLKGVLNLPAGKGPFGVVDIIPGSGPVNINGNGHDSHGGIAYSPYKKLAAALVKDGWAVARVAKRGMPPSTGDGNHIIFSDQVADNLAVVEALRKNSHIDSKRIVVGGHSLGGLIAPKLATETKLAGLILLEAPGESMKKITTAQVLEANEQAGVSGTALAAIREKQEGFYPKVAQTPPGKSLRYAGKTLPPATVQLLKSWYAQKPLETARKVKVPVLVVQGGKDTQVPPGNGKRLVKALPHGELLYLPKMDHDLTLEKEGIGKDAKLAPKLTADIVAWLHHL